MKETSLVHIIADGCVLMMHRISKKNDINHGKWIGVGGKFEWGETPEECMRREVREETGLWVDQYRYCGIVTFVSDDDDMEYMHLFTVTAFHDRDQASGKDVRLRECDEGTLEWIPKEMLSRIPHWAGDRIFLPLILDMEIPFFSMKLVYQKGTLIHASMNEHNCFVTQRLVLRPWLAEDAAALYQWAKNPKIGPSAGWPAHRDIAESREAIRNVLKRPEIYAIVLRDYGTPIGSVGLQNFRLADADESMLTFFDERKSENPLACSRPSGDFRESPECQDYQAGSRCSGGFGESQASRAGSDCLEGRGESQEAVAGSDRPEERRGSQESRTGSDRPEEHGECQAFREDGMQGLRVEAALGYWLAEPYWHQGIMTEAAEAVLSHARRDLGIRRVWADYYEGNDPSRKVMERLGFHFHHIEKDRYIELLGERRTAVVQVKTM